jgi:Bax protein
MNRLKLLAFFLIFAIISFGVYFTVNQKENQRSAAKKPPVTSHSTPHNTSHNTPKALIDPKKTPQTKEIATKKIEAEKKPIRKVVDVKLKKKRFFELLMPMIIIANDRVIKERNRVLQFQNKHQSGTALTVNDFDRLREIGGKYKLPIKVEKNSPKLASYLDSLLIRVDIIPASLILAQSANESAWGTSRFARDANNYFGMWCFSQGCGLKPARRTSGLTHEVAKFDSVQHGVVRYIQNLNTNSAYKALRAIRSKARSTSQPIAGINLAEGLVRYSERGETYVEEIQSMIRFNKLEGFNR